ncbi:metal ABC transporter ATP-binding protein [Chitiniphilus eburneus]|uniref:ABC transporter ATP-binding protein n=1 Tax=Chitiniphilus eburneus TaxID=2571148 RepID=A0A4U0Q1K3_9NEIS|nr:ABC transporter ATP-binding protein [Chitiniphilus eburneus]TJZ74789.1 ABC transporter ATP-binding protein [Chitiniphilus eburneus]
MSDALLSLHNVTLAYRRHPAVHHLSGALARGSLTALVGPNGAGKSTLLKAILGQLPVQEGRIELKLPRARIAYLPQQSALERQFPISVLDAVLLGSWVRRGLFGGIPLAERERALAALAAVGLSGFAARTVATLSVGQFQRVLFARLMLQDADLILLDEPFNAVDARTTADLLALVRRWHGEGRTVLAVLHDHQQVRTHFPQTLLLARRAIAWGDTATVLTGDHLHAAQHMVEAWDDHAQPCAPGVPA